MTRTYLFALLVIAVVGETGLATNEPAGITSLSDFENRPISPQLFTETGVSGSIDFGPNGETGLENPDALSDRVIRDGYQSVKEWLHGDGYASMDKEPAEFWRGTKGCEAFPIATMRTSQFDWPILTPVVFRNPNGEEFTLSAGLTPVEVIKLIQPLPDCVHKLLKLDRSAAKKAGIWQSLEVEGNPDDRPTYSDTRGWESESDRNRWDDFVEVSSILYPHLLFRLHFEGAGTPELKRVQIVDGYHLLWLRHAHRENPHPQRIVEPYYSYGGYPSTYTVLRHIVDGPRRSNNVYQLFPVLE